MPEVELSNIVSMMAPRTVDAIRRRPGLYVGDTEDGSGLHDMVDKLVDNAVDEARAADVPRITVALGVDGAVTVADNGHGLPTGIDSEAGISTPEVIMTGIVSGQRVIRHTDPATPMTPRERHHLGLAAVNALSARLLLRIWRDGHEHEIEFAHGVAAYPLRLVGAAGLDEEGRPKRGTAITSWPSYETFTKVDVVYGTVKRRLRKVVRLNPGVHVALTDARPAKPRHDELAP